ncbi:MAG: molybdenum cofactor synthesis domain-containing protein [Betaproteobacteria bacterium]
MEGRIVAVNTSATKSVRKQSVAEVILKEEWGIEGDAHAAPWHRQVSLLALESIRKMQEKGLKVKPGDFAENLTTEGLDLPALPIGTRLRVGDGVLLEVTQIGKVCHTKCAIYYQAGDCVMPREGIFARVLQGGKVVPGDRIEVVEQPAEASAAPKPAWRVAVLTASDKGSRGERVDESGPAIQRAVAGIGGQVVAYHVLPDVRKVLAETMAELCDREQCDLILTTGGTGLGPRDVTPEATLDVIERTVPGIPEAVRGASLRHTPRAMLSRGVAGIRRRTLIVNLPGSPKAVQECLEVILPALPHALGILTGKENECARPLAGDDSTAGDKHKQLL